MREDYLRSSFVDLETAPHTNGNGLFLGVAFTTGAKTTLKRGEHVMVQVPHLTPQITEPVQNLLNYKFDDFFSYDRGQQPGSYTTTGEHLFIAAEAPPPGFAVGWSDRPSHQRYQCTKDCVETSFNLTLVPRNAAIDSEMVNYPYTHYAMMLTAVRDINPGTKFKLGVRVDPTVACDGAISDAGPTLVDGVAVANSAHSVKRSARVKVPAVLGADKKECVKWSTFLRRNDALWVIDSNTKSVRINPPIKFTASEPFGGEKERGEREEIRGIELGREGGRGGGSARKMAHSPQHTPSLRCALDSTNTDPPVWKHQPDDALATLCNCNDEWPSDV